MTVMGRDGFDLDLPGKLEGNMLEVAGNIPETERRLTAILIKLRELPASA
jgi:hypothetical protein